MKPYHRSREMIVSPEIRDANRFFDYESGFYTTASFEKLQQGEKKNESIQDR